MSQQAILGIIGGSGLYHFEGLENVESMEVTTPFGKPSAPILIGSLAGKRVAFLARHGIGHHILPSEVNYRANIYALKQLGVRFVVGVSACGSLRHDYKPGNFVIPDQVIDFTRDRKRSFFGEGLVAHISTADPYCSSLSRQLYEAALSTGVETHMGGTFITIEGPRFSTRAESHLFRAWGISIIGMTTCPEIFLAREAEMCYANLAHITDYDVWHLAEEPVNVEMVIRTLSQNTAAAQQAIRTLVTQLDENTDCECSNALEKALITDPARIPPETRQKLALLVDKYLKP
ncbi:MAG: S-methyl-5'-thioadenosine phosphorylase [Chloroflexota bacterium]